MRDNYVVAFYEIDREYGGPEEGGWYYDSGVLCRTFKVCKSENEANRIARRANRIFAYLQRDMPSVDSVIYCGGRYKAFVFENSADLFYPSQRPYYE
jgi:hypothetical protein